MNAPQPTATCPTCNGSGQRVKHWVKWGSERERSKPQRCLACRGTGQVDPIRVCPACAQWADQCTCPKSKIIKLEARAMGDQQGGQTGVHRSKRDNRWMAYIHKNGKQHNLGYYEDIALAIAIRAEAEQLPPSEYPALKAKYKALRKANQNGNGHSAPEPDEAVIEAEAPDLPTADTLHRKLVAARAADRRFQAIREQYCAAERDAVDAWNEYARELAVYAQSDAFSRSYLGFLREEITRS